mmetsp:Transcript_81094/g.229688  ORF Transcript_81094/g.229688 Transcript_81094/m.229688 type:complete len:284 (+) Transcript_81094:78-929(+)
MPVEDVGRLRLGALALEGQLRPEHLHLLALDGEDADGLPVGAAAADHVVGRREPPRAATFSGEQVLGRHDPVALERHQPAVNDVEGQDLVVCLTDRPQGRETFALHRIPILHHLLLALGNYQSVQRVAAAGRICREALCSRAHLKQGNSGVGVAVVHNRRRSAQQDHRPALVPVAGRRNILDGAVHVAVYVLQLPFHLVQLEHTKPVSKEDSPRLRTYERVRVEEGARSVELVERVRLQSRLMENKERVVVLPVHATKGAADGQEGPAACAYPEEAENQHAMK